MFSETLPSSHDCAQTDFEAVSSSWEEEGLCELSESILVNNWSCGNKKFDRAVAAFAVGSGGWCCCCC